MKSEKVTSENAVATAENKGYARCASTVSGCITNCISERRRTLNRWAVKKVVFVIGVIMLMTAVSSEAKALTQAILRFPTGECLYLEIICTKKSDSTCTIDGWCHLIDCSALPKIVKLKTVTFYYNFTSCNGFSGSIFGIPLSSIFSHPDFPPLSDCCGCGNGTGPGGPGGPGTDPSDTCKPVPFILRLSSGTCITVDIICCDGVIRGTYNIVDCLTGTLIDSGDFKAVYTGNPNSPNMYNDPSFWKWDGDPNAPSDILDVLKNANLAPCIK